jgi:hypothetical protein
MLRRQAEPTLRRLAGYYPVVAVIGPRQSGKTTLVKSTFPKKDYVSLEDPDVREFVRVDPRGFLAQHRAGAILDEAQRCPELCSYLQTEVDAEPTRGRYILTGSQQFGLFSGITQSLAGRVGVLRLLPFSLAELGALGKSLGLEDLLWRGFYPPIHDRGIPPGQWFSDYVETYVERDVRQMINVRDLGAFGRFVRMCAARTGQLLNLSSVAADCGVTHNTAKAWISVLEASYLVHLLPPYHRNFGKRLIKTPKLYFLDVGLAAWLSGIREADQLQTHPLRGALFETWVVGELMKHRLNRGEPPELYFWRHVSGHEVDIVAETGGTLVPMEIKAGQTVAADYFRGLDRLSDLSGAALGALIYAGDKPQARSRWRVFPWREVDKACELMFGKR